MSSLRDAFAGLRALADCGTVMAYGHEPQHLRAAVDAGWASRRVTWEGQKRWRYIYSLKVDRNRAINMLASARVTRRAA